MRYTSLNQQLLSLLQPFLYWRVWIVFIIATLFGGCAPTTPAYQTEGNRVKFRGYCAAHTQFKQPGSCVDSFYLDSKPVTQVEFMAVMDTNPSLHKGCDSCPVERVTWEQADTYCRKLHKRLPKFGEWMYGLYAGNPRIFEQGSKAQTEFFEQTAWTTRNSGGQTHPVGQLHASNSGLFDMLGNVGEFLDESMDTSGLPVERLHTRQYEGSKRLYGVAGCDWSTFNRSIQLTHFKYVPDFIREAWTGFRCIEPLTR